MIYVYIDIYIYVTVTASDMFTAPWDILGKQYEFPCRPEWKFFERPRHVTDTIQTCLRRPLSNDEKTVILQPPPCEKYSGKVRLCRPT